MESTRWNVHREHSLSIELDTGTKIQTGILEEDIDIEEELVKASQAFYENSSSAVPLNS